MKTILHLTSSIFGNGGQSSRLAEEFVAQFPRAWVIAHGGLYRGRGTARDTQTAYVRDFLAFLGITDVQFVFAEGLAISEASKSESVAKARGVLRDLAQPERIAA